MVTLEDIKKQYLKVDEKLDRIMQRHKYLQDAAAEGRIEQLDLKSGNGADAQPSIDVDASGAAVDAAQGADMEGYSAAREASRSVGEVPAGKMADGTKDKPRK